jgi:hypothetical protein
MGVQSTQAQKKWDEKAALYLVDSLFLKKKPTKPSKATLLSAVLPGAGQVYNRQYHKLVIVYGAIGGMIYAVDFNTRNFKLFDKAYRAKLKGEDLPVGIPDAIPIASLENRRAEFRKNRELSYFGLGLMYVFNVADAFVSSHLSSFNIEDDLVRGRFKFMDMMEVSGQPFPCLGVVVSF